MDRLGYEVFKVESASAVCPPEICPGARTRRPGVLERLAGGGRPARFHHWVGAIRQRPRAGLLLPARADAARAVDLPAVRAPEPAGGQRPDRRHQQARRVRRPGPVRPQPPAPPAPGGLHRPSGRRAARAAAAHRAARARADRGDRRPRLLVPGGRDEPAAPERAQRRGDRAGAVLREGARADGGPRGPEPRRATSTWWRRSRTCSAAPVFYRQDGRSAFSGGHEARTGDRDRARATSRSVVRIGLPEMQRRRAAWRQRWARLFGTGAESELLYGDPWALAYRIGPHRELLGRRVAALPARTRARRAERASAANARCSATCRSATDRSPRA